MNLGRDLADFSFGPFPSTLGELLFDSADFLFRRDYACDALLQKQSVGFGALLIIFFVYLAHLKEDCV